MRSPALLPQAVDLSLPGGAGGIAKENDELVELHVKDELGDEKGDDESCMWVGDEAGDDHEWEGDAVARLSGGDAVLREAARTLALANDIRGWADEWEGGGEE
jgi:hypothetical protein